MDFIIILLFHFLIYGIPPFLIAKFITKYESMTLFYAYFGFLFVFTQLFAIFYSIKITEDLFITGGNIAYSSIILLTFCIAIISQDPVVVRNLILIQIFLNVFLFFLYLLLFTILNSPYAINIFNVSPEIFRATITVNIISSFVFVIEILIMFYVLEKIKMKLKNQLFIAILYVLVFMSILCLDGFLFPFFMNMFEPELGTAITGGIFGKLILGMGFSPFLIAFLIFHRESFKKYLEEPFNLRYIIIPPRKKLIEELEEAEEKYHEAFNRANFYKDLFTHDIRNIIQNIGMSVELIVKYQNKEESVKSEKFKELHEIMKHQIKAAKNLIINITKLSALDEAKKSELLPINLSDSLSKAITLVKEGFQQKMLNIQVDPVDKNIKVKANELLFDVFENILINAVKYNENKILEISIKISKINEDKINYIKLEFIDNGIGINDSLKKLIFLREYKELKGEKGMGIGLSLVFRIIQFYKGKIWVENKEKEDYTQGSNFVVLIPQI